MTVVVGLADARTWNVEVEVDVDPVDVNPVRPCVCCCFHPVDPRPAPDLREHAHRVCHALGLFDQRVEARLEQRVVRRPRGRGAVPSDSSRDERGDEADRGCRHRVRGDPGPGRRVTHGNVTKADASSSCLSRVYISAPDRCDTNFLRITCARGFAGRIRPCASSVHALIAVPGPSSLERASGRV